MAPSFCDLTVAPPEAGDWPLNSPSPGVSGDLSSPAPQPLSLVSSDWPVACGRRPQHGQPPIRLQHLRQPLQHHPGRHHHPGKRVPQGFPAAAPRGASSFLQPPQEQKMGALITAPRPIYDSVIKLKMLLHMEMISDEFQGSWGSGMGWRDGSLWMSLVGAPQHPGHLCTAKGRAP